MRYADFIDRLIELKVVEDQTKNNRKKVIRSHHALDRSSISRISAIINNGDLYVNKEIPNVSSQYTPEQQTSLKYYRSPSVYHYPNPSSLKKVILSQSEEVYVLIKTLFSQVRRSELGDKFSSRYGQKGVLCLMILER